MFRILFLIPFFMVELSALMYEDAEDLNSKRWISVSSKYPGKITNLFDKEKVSRIIKFDGYGTKSIYRLPIPSTLENIQMDNSFFSWEMNYSEDFVIIIVLDTLDGKRHLIYTPDDRNSYLQYGLDIIEKGKWKKFSRNLEKDLQLYEEDNKIILIKDFIIKGSGLVDNIQLKRLNREITPLVVKKVVKETPKKPERSYKNDIVPVLKLKGKNPLVLKVGEEYVEEGASAKNRDGSEIDIKITDNIDVLTEGEYTVIYFATNKLGNSSVDKRQVIVGKIRNKKAECKITKCNEGTNLFKEKSMGIGDYPRNKEELLQLVSPLMDPPPPDKYLDKKEEIEEKESSEHRFPKKDYKDEKLMKEKASSNPRFPKKDYKLMKEKYPDKKEEFKDKKDEKLLNEKYPDKKEDK